MPSSNVMIGSVVPPMRTFTSIAQCLSDFGRSQLKLCGNRKANHKLRSDVSRATKALVASIALSYGHKVHSDVADNLSSNKLLRSKLLYMNAD